MSDKYTHPETDLSLDIRSHLFNRQSIVSVKGELPTIEETGISKDDYWKMQQRIGDGLGETEAELLKRLGIPAISGLPLSETTKADYLTNNTLFISTEETESHAYAYPNAGRAVTKKEGWVAPNGQVFTEHNIKGVGMTESAPKYFKLMYSSGSKPGSEYAEVCHQGHRIPSTDYQDEPMFCVQRGWASDIRLSGLFRALSEIMEAYDIKVMMGNPDLTRKVFESRVNRFLLNARKVDEFNVTHGTRYFLGCSPFLKKDYSYESYAHAFREQMALNIGRMIGRYLYHANFHFQQVSVACEIGDWDKWYRVYPEQYSDSHQRDELVLGSSGDVFRTSYEMQAVVSAVLADGDYISAADWWSMINEHLGSSNVMAAIVKKVGFDHLYQERGFRSIREAGLIDLANLYKS